MSLDNTIKKISGNIDWILFSASMFLVLVGLITMNSFVGQNYFFEKQIVWTLIGITFFFILSFVDFRFLRSAGVIISLFAVSTIILLLLFMFGDFVKGAQNRFDFGIFSFQPADPIKLVAIVFLAKYFSRRHI